MISALIIDFILNNFMYSIFSFVFVNNYTKQLKFILLKNIEYGTDLDF